MLLNPSKYKLNSIKLVSGKGKVVDILNIFTRFYIDESIYNYCLTGSIDVLDANNLISGSLSALPLMGNELLAIDISIPTMVSKEKNNDNISDADEYYFNNYNIVGIFRITSIKRNLEREKLQSYNIQFASEEFVLNENLNISKAYSNRTPSEISEQLFNESFRSINSKSQFETTSNKLSFISPLWHPFKVINWMASRSISNNTNCSTYFFYENLYSNNVNTTNNKTNMFNFKSLVTMLKSEYVKRIVFGMANVPITDGTNSANLSKYVKAISYQIVKDFDTIESINAGLFTNKLIAHDIINKKYTELDYNYDNRFSDMPHLGKSGKIYSGMMDASGKRFTDYYGSAVYMHPLGNSFGNNYIDKIVGPRTSQLASLQHCNVNILVPGDGQISAGNVIKFKLPSPESVPAYDSFYDGKYLVTAIRHHFETEEYTMSLACAKETPKIDYDEYSRL